MKFFSRNALFIIVILNFSPCSLVAMDSPLTASLIEIMRFTHSSNVFGRVSLLVREGIDVHEEDKEGNTTLMHALNLPTMEVANILVEASPSLVDRMNNKGETALSIQIRKKNILGVEFLLKNGAWIHSWNGQCHALKQVIDGAIHNKVSSSKLDGGLSSWSLTQDLVKLVGDASSFKTICKALKYTNVILRCNPQLAERVKAAYRKNIIAPLCALEKQKAEEVREQRAVEQKTQSSKKRKRDEDTILLPETKRLRSSVSYIEID